MIANPQRSQARLEALAARQAYGLDTGELAAVMGAFEKLTKEERSDILTEYENLNATPCA